MSIEEAIEVLEQDIPNEHDKDLVEAMNMAINLFKAIIESCKIETMVYELKVEPIKPYRKCFTPYNGDYCNAIIMLNEEESEKEDAD